MTINEQIIDGATQIALTEDTVENVVIPAGKQVTIDLAGFKLSNDAEAGSEYTITNFGTLTIEDSGETGTIFNNIARKGCIVNRKGGVVKINGGTYELNERPSTDAWYYIVNIGKSMQINSAKVIGMSPNASTVRNGFYTAQETADDYDD